MNSHEPSPPPTAPSACPGCESLRQRLDEANIRAVDAEAGFPCVNERDTTITSLRDSLVAANAHAAKLEREAHKDRASIVAFLAAEAKRRDKEARSRIMSPSPCVATVNSMTVTGRSRRSRPPSGGWVVTRGPEGDLVSPQPSGLRLPWYLRDRERAACLLPADGLWNAPTPCGATICGVAKDTREMHERLHFENCLHGCKAAHIPAADLVSIDAIGCVVGDMFTGFKQSIEAPSKTGIAIALHLGGWRVGMSVEEAHAIIARSGILLYEVTPIARATGGGE